MEDTVATKLRDDLTERSFCYVVTVQFLLVRNWKWYNNIFSPLMASCWFERDDESFSLIFFSYLGVGPLLLFLDFVQLCFVLHLNQHTMSKKRAMSRCAGSDHGCGQRGACITKVDGYNNDISPQVQSIIDDWERTMVNKNLAHNVDGVSPNLYWIVKNMMGSLMEEILGRWNNSKLKISEATSKMMDLDMVIMERDIMGMWKKLALGVDSLGDGGSGNVSMAPEMNVDLAPMIPDVSTMPVTISELFKGGQECDAYVGKRMHLWKKQILLWGKQMPL